MGLCLVELGYGGWGCGGKVLDDGGANVETASHFHCFERVWEDLAYLG